MKNQKKKVFLSLLGTIAVGLIYYYFTLPAINFQDSSFYVFFILLAAVYLVFSTIGSGIWQSSNPREVFRGLKKNAIIPLCLCAAFVAIYLLGALFSSQIFQAKAYHQLLTVEQGSFQDDVEEISYTQIPMLDRASAEKLGDRKLGELSDMVSQFEVANDYGQINFQGRPVRVTPLIYGDLIKWLNNTSSGYPAYLMIDMVDQSVEVVRLETGMKYSTDEHFFRNVSRRLRFLYPTMIFDTPSFEVNDQGDPYWICPRIVKRIGLFGGTDIQGAVLMNAVTGECQYFDSDQVPTWVDRLYSAELIIEQYDYYGQYGNGFFNSLFGQKGVTVTTEGYNYIAMDDDVYMYTGVTSVGGDESNVGFILSNQRTKETKYYSIAGAEEYSAMNSAQGVVQHLGYQATFPLLLNINGQATYFMSLKDNAGLVKMYAMVNVQQYQIVATGNTVNECEGNYQKLLKQQGVSQPETSADQEVTGVIADLRSAVMSGTTWYYLQLRGQSVYYTVSVEDVPEAVLLSVGDRVTVEYVPSEGETLLSVVSLVRK